MTEDIVPPPKRCTKCGAEYPATLKYFAERKEARDGLRGTCRECCRATSRNWRDENREHHKAQKKEYYETHREESLARNRRWRQENPERERLNNTKWRENNPERSRELNRLSRARNKDNNNAKSRARYHSTTEYQRARRRKYWQNNKEKRTVTIKAWQASNPEKMKEYADRYRVNKGADYGARYREENRDKLRDYHKRRPDVFKVARHRRKARKRSLPDAFTVKDWHRALDYFNGCCAVCERPLRDLFGKHTAAADHWIPLSSLDCPGTIPTNIVPLCHGAEGCNNSKWNIQPEEWLIKKFGKRKAKTILDRINAYFKWIEQQ